MWHTGRALGEWKIVELLSGIESQKIMAILCARSRTIAMKIYKRILEFRPDWTEKVAIVMTESNNMK